MADLFIVAEAEQDYAEALAWYAERSPRAANGFEHEVERLFDSIAQHPGRFPLCDDRHRFCLMRRYPFQIIYRETPQGALVVAVAHAKRRPGYWTGR